MSSKLKVFTVSLLTSCCATAVSSQTLGTFNGAGQGWFVSGAIGVNGYAGEYDGERSFGSRVSIGGEVSVGKWITPVVGVRIQTGGYNMQGITASLQEERINYGLVHGDIMVDAIAFFKGVDKERFYTFIPYMGFGSGLRPNKDYNSFIFALGGVNRFRLSEHLDANVELKGVLFNDKFDGTTGGRKHDGSLTLTAGFTYNF